MLPEQLKLYTQQLLSTNDREVASMCVHQMSELYNRTLGDTYDQLDNKLIDTAYGPVLSTQGAAGCIFDRYRVYKFLSGIHAVMRDIWIKEPSICIHILYCGCGPYATQLTPLTSLYTPQQVQFHLVDINPISLEIVQDLYSRLGITDYIASIHQQDCCIWVIPEDITVHIVTSETMVAGLGDETQVPIMHNIIPQIDDAIFIPESIHVLVDNVPFYHISRHSSNNPQNTEGSTITTRVILYKDITLESDECDITRTIHQDCSLSYEHPHIIYQQLINHTH